MAASQNGLMPCGIQTAEKDFFRFPCPGMDIGYFIENRFQGGLNRFIVILDIKDLIFYPIHGVLGKHGGGPGEETDAEGGAGILLFCGAS